MADGAGAPSTTNTMLTQLDMGMSEFVFCCAFWLAAFVLSSFISLNAVLSFPPIAMTISLMGTVSDMLPTIGAIVGLVAMLAVVVMYRKEVGKSLLVILRKITGGGKRR